MKRMYILFLGIAMALVFTNCAHKAAAKTEPVKQQAPGVEKVDEKIPLAQKGTQVVETADQSAKEGVLKRINFDFDKYQIRDDMMPILQANAEWLTKHKSARILIEGHCDERGTEEYNIGLGEKRAQSAKEHLVSLGVAAANIKTISYGKSRPLVKGVDEGTWFQNRRCEFIISSK